MSEQIVETTLVETPAVPFYKNKKIVLATVAVTAVAVGLAVLKFKSNSDAEETEETTSLTADTSSTKK